MNLIRRLSTSLFLLLLMASCIGSIAPTSQGVTQIPTSGINPIPFPEPSSTVIPPQETLQEISPTQEAAPASDLLALQKKGLLPEFAEDVESNQDLTYYSIDVEVEFDPDEEFAIFNGETQIRYTNSTEVLLDDIVLMLWPKDEQYRAVMEAGPIKIDGKDVEHQVELEGLALRISLNPGLLPGEFVEISVPFSIRTEGSISNQRKRFGITNGVLMAPTFYPLIPRIVDGEWQVEVAPAGGDTTNSVSAYFEVTITTSENFEVVASGIEINRELLHSDQKSVTFVTGPMRDFAFALGKLEKRSMIVDGVVLNAWTLPWHLRDGEKMLNAAAQQMEFLQDLVGPYPYVDLDIVDTPCSFGGIEYPGLVYICSMDDGYYVDTTVHEIAHQWFYALIGNDQLQEPWLDEAMASYWQVLYYEKAIGADRANIQLNNYRSWVNRPEDREAPIGLGIEDYRLIGDYYTVVYFKGALFLDALRSELGDKVFFEFLNRYYQDFRYDFADSHGFQATAEEVCGCDLNDLFNLWVFEGGEVFK